MEGLCIQETFASRKVKERVVRVSKIQNQNEIEKRVLWTLGATSPIGIIATDRNGRCIYVNKRWCEITGMNFDEASNDGWIMAIHPNDREFVTTEWRQFLQERHSFKHRFRFLNSDGVVNWVQGESITSFNDSDHSVGYVLVVLDVTDLIQTEEALKKKIEVLSLAQWAAQLGLYEWDGESNQAYWTPEMEQLMGLNLENRPNNLDQWIERVHPDDRPQIESLFESWIHSDQPDRTQEYRLLKEGEYRWIEVRGRIIRDKNGKPLRIVGTKRDITEQKRIERRLIESERIYRAIGESINYGIWICDPDGKNTYASESFLNLVGMTQEECSSFGWGNVLHPDDAERTISAWKECVKTEGKWDIEHRFLGKDGQWHSILARGIPVYDDSGKIICWAGINLDIRDLKKTQEDLQSAVNARDDFLSVASHELKTPLTALLLELQLLSDVVRKDASAPKSGYLSLKWQYEIVRNSLN